MEVSELAFRPVAALNLIFPTFKSSIDFCGGFILNNPVILFPIMYAPTADPKIPITVRISGKTLKSVKTHNITPKYVTMLGASQIIASCILALFADLFVPHFLLAVGV